MMERPYTDRERALEPTVSGTGRPKSTSIPSVGNRSVRWPIAAVCLKMAVRPEGANYLWRKNPSRELSIDLVADERPGRATGRGEAS
jgi:hypothetical protein